MPFPFLMISPYYLMCLYIADAHQISAQLEPTGSTLVPIQENLVDVAWGKERPEAPKDKVFVQPVKYAGKQKGQVFLYMECNTTKVNLFRKSSKNYVTILWIRTHTAPLYRPWMKLLGCTI
jgi:hypothetical protein